MPQPEATFTFHHVPRHEGKAVAIYHTAGKGTRLAPLPGAENNNKPGRFEWFEWFEQFEWFETWLGDRFGTLDLPSWDHQKISEVQTSEGGCL
jgi:hypothetical protein